MRVIKESIFSYEIFERIKHIDKYEAEYWEARELQDVLEYKEWRKFENVIKKATTSCINSGFDISDHFVGVDKMITIGKGAQRKQRDYKLSRYACYLVAQNSDPRKLTISLAQTYFAIQTRKMEIVEKEYSKLSEDEKRLYQRHLTKKGNYSLNQTAKESGVKNFDKFHNYGYRGLYNGLTANEIAQRKGLRYREDILDNMGSEELIINLFRISQTEQKLKKDKINSEKEANITHYKVGSKIRKTIQDLDGIVPEDLPTPVRSLKQISKENELLKKDNMECKNNKQVTFLSSKKTEEADK